MVERITPTRNMPERATQIRSSTNISQRAKQQKQQQQQQSKINTENQAVIKNSVDGFISNFDNVNKLKSEAASYYSENLSKVPGQSQSFFKSYLESKIKGISTSIQNTISRLKEDAFSLRAKLRTTTASNVSSNLEGRLKAVQQVLNAVQSGSIVNYNNARNFIAESGSVAGSNISNIQKQITFQKSVNTKFVSDKMKMAQDFQDVIANDRINLDIKEKRRTADAINEFGSDFKDFYGGRLQSVDFSLGRPIPVGNKTVFEDYLAQGKNTQAKAKFEALPTKTQNAIITYSAVITAREELKSRNILRDIQKLYPLTVASVVPLSQNIPDELKGVIPKLEKVNVATLTKLREISNQEIINSMDTQNSFTRLSSALDNYNKYIGNINTLVAFEKKQNLSNQKGSIAALENKIRSESLKRFNYPLVKLFNLNPKANSFITAMTTLPYRNALTVLNDKISKGQTITDSDLNEYRKTASDLLGIKELVTKTNREIDLKTKDKSKLNALFINLAIFSMFTGRSLVKIAQYLGQTIKFVYKAGQSIDNLIRVPVRETARFLSLQYQLLSKFEKEKAYGETQRIYSSLYNNIKKGFSGAKWVIDNPALAGLGLAVVTAGAFKQLRSTTINSPETIVGFIVSEIIEDLTLMKMFKLGKIPQIELEKLAYARIMGDSKEFALDMKTYKIIVDKMPKNKAVRTLTGKIEGKLFYLPNNGVGIKYTFVDRSGKRITTEARKLLGDASSIKKAAKSEDLARATNKLIKLNNYDFTAKAIINLDTGKLKVFGGKLGGLTNEQWLKILNFDNRKVLFQKIGEGEFVKGWKAQPFRATERFNLLPGKVKAAVGRAVSDLRRSELLTPLYTNFNKIKARFLQDKRTLLKIIGSRGKGSIFDNTMSTIAEFKPSKFARKKVSDIYNAAADLKKLILRKDEIRKEAIKIKRLMDKYIRGIPLQRNEKVFLLEDKRYLKEFKIKTYIDKDGTRVIEFPDLEKIYERRLAKLDPDLVKIRKKIAPIEVDVNHYVDEFGRKVIDIKEINPDVNVKQLKEATKGLKEIKIPDVELKKAKDVLNKAADSLRLPKTEPKLTFEVYKEVVQKDGTVVLQKMKPPELKLKKKLKKTTLETKQKTRSLKTKQEQKSTSKVYTTYDVAYEEVLTQQERLNRLDNIMRQQSVKMNPTISIKVLKQTNTVVSTLTAQIKIMSKILSGLDSKLGKAQVSALESKLATAQATRSKFANANKKISAIIQDKILGITSIQDSMRVLKPAIANLTKYSLTPVNTNKLKPINFNTTDPIKPVDLKRFKIKLSWRNKKSIGKLTWLVNGLVKSKGRIRELPIKTTPNRAFKYMDKLVDNTTARSFQLKIIGTTTKKDIPRQNMTKYRTKLSNNPLVLAFVEKSRYAIDTPGEKKGLRVSKRLKEIRNKNGRNKINRKTTKRRKNKR